MSNHLAIATVTAALGRFVHAAAEASGVGSVGLDFGRPTLAGEGQGTRKVQIYLYHVSPNAALRNNDLPTRGSDGNLVDRPQIALDLHYLLAFYGNQKTLEPDRMLGAVARNLHARPILSRQAIRDAISNHPELTESDLADAIERVRFTPAAMSLDELSKLWSIFFQTPHALSVVYHANVVLIEAEESGPPALPVLQRGDGDRGITAVADAASPFPALDKIHIGIPEDAGANPLPRAYPAAQLGSFLILSGRNFAGDTVEITFRHSRYSEAEHPEFLAPKSLTVPPGDRSATELRIAIPGDTVAQKEWRAGPYTVSVKVTDGGKTHASNALPLTLSPKIQSISPANPVSRDASGNITLTLTAIPQVQASQAVTLLLADREVSATPRTAGTDPLQFAIPSAPIVTEVVVRLRVDGIDSIPFERTQASTVLEFAANQKVTIV